MNIYISIGQRCSGSAIRNERKLENEASASARAAFWGKNQLTDIARVKKTIRKGGRDIPGGIPGQTQGGEESSIHHIEFGFVRLRGLRFAVPPRAGAWISSLLRAQRG